MTQTEKAASSSTLSEPTSGQTQYCDIASLLRSDDYNASAKVSNSGFYSTSISIKSEWHGGQELENYCTGFQALPFH